MCLNHVTSVSSLLLQFITPGTGILKLLNSLFFILRLLSLTLTKDHKDVFNRHTHRDGQSMPSVSNEYFPVDYYLTWTIEDGQVKGRYDKKNVEKRSCLSDLLSMIFG